MQPRATYPMVKAEAEAEAAAAATSFWILG